MCHIAIAIGVGVLFNLSSSAVIAGPVIIAAIIFPIFTSYFHDAVAVTRMLMASIKDNTLEGYKDSARTLGKGIELSVVTNGSMSRSTSPAPSASAVQVAAGGKDGVTETAVGHQTSENSPEMGEHNEPPHLTASLTTFPDPGERDLADQDEDEVYVSPNRQDTESGLRGLRPASG